MLLYKQCLHAGTHSLTLLSPYLYCFCWTWSKCLMKYLRVHTHCLYFNFFWCGAELWCNPVLCVMIDSTSWTLLRAYRLQRRRGQWYTVYTTKSKSGSKTLLHLVTRTALVVYYYKEWGSLLSPPHLLSGKGRQLIGIWDLYTEHVHLWHPVGAHC